MNGSNKPISFCNEGKGLEEQKLERGSVGGESGQFVTQYHEAG